MIECNLEKIWKTNSPRYPRYTFPEVFHIRLSFLHLMSNGLEKIWKTNSPRYPRNTFPEVFHIRLSFLHLMSNGLTEVFNSLMQIVAFYKVCEAYLVKAHNNLISSNPT